MTVITVGQRKGGNGKSTSSLNLAASFAEQGKKVLLIDLDDQRNSTSAIETAFAIITPSTRVTLNPGVVVTATAFKSLK